MKITVTVTETEKSDSVKTLKISLTEKYVKEKTTHPRLNLLASGA